MALTKVNATNIIDGVLPVANGGTGATTQAGAAAAVLPSQTGQSGKYLATDGTNTSWDQINISTADITGTLPVANGGTGQTTANAGFNALAPSQTGNSGKYLTTDGTNTSWDQINISTADITGTLPVANGGTGATTASAARTSLGLVIGTDVLAPNGSGASLTALNASNISSGTVATARLASGTADSTTFLRGDQTWAAVSVTPTAVSDQNNTSTGFFDLPAGTTAQRPVSANAGYTRYNTTESAIEVYNGTSWKKVTDTNFTYAVEFLAVAGGGGGGSINGGNPYAGGGGGAGGYIDSTATLTEQTAYSIVIGAGGASSNGGNNTTGLSSTAIAGGSGSGSFSGPGSGGSGGGGNGSNQGGGSGTSGQGNSGGSGVTATNSGGGGGGGYSVSGGGGSNGNGGTGGAGGNWKSLGTYYAGGGGGGVEQSGTAGSGGNGGGGAGAVNTASATAGTSNTGGGGGGGGRYNSGGGAAGGSGVFIIRYAGSQRGTGGTVTSSGGYTYHTFTTSGTYTA